MDKTVISGLQEKFIPLRKILDHIDVCRDQVELESEDLKKSC